MIGLVRALTLAALLVLGLTSAHAADKAFKRDDLADAAIRLETQIKPEAGAVNKTAQQLKTDVDSAFRRNDFRAGLQLIGQLTAVAPNDSGNWLRLAGPSFDASLALEMMGFTGPEVKEGLAALREKRAPNFPAEPKDF